MLDIGSVLEAGLRFNDVAQHALGAASDTFQHMSFAAISSDCCSSNNYPTTPPQ